MVLFAIVVVLAIILPSCTGENPNRPRAFCQHNLKCIGIYCKIYANEHNGQMPTTFNDLDDDSQTSDGSSIFICPASSDKVGDPTTIDAWSSYEIVYHGKLIDDQNLVVVQEKNDHTHPPGGRNYLFSDGHVSFKLTKPFAPTSER